MDRTEPSFRFCSLCGERHDPHSLYCTSCGSELKGLQSAEHGSGESGLDSLNSASSKRRAPLAVLLTLGAASLIVASIFLTRGLEEAEEQVEETLAECVVGSDLLTLSERTSAAIKEMGTSLEVATAVGTRDALLGALDGLNSVYGPRFTSLAVDWRAIDSCGDEELVTYTTDLASELESIGQVLTFLNEGDAYELVGVQRNLTEITRITGDLGAYVGSL